MLSSEGLCRCSIILIASIFTSGTIKKSLLSVQNLILSHLKNVSTVLIQGWVRSPPIGHYDLWPVIFCPQGSSVAQLKATDPEGEPLIYGVSGEEAMKYFSVNKDTGVVWLRQQLDREVWGKHKLCLRMQITKANLLQKKKKKRNSIWGLFWKWQTERKSSHDERAVNVWSSEGDEKDFWVAF